MAKAHIDGITAVPGIEVGHASDKEGLTGCTVVICRSGAVGGVDVRGSAPGTRETDLLRPENLVEKVHAVLLTGGSAFGLDAAGGVMRHLEERGIGHDTGVARVPIVPAAVLFDLPVGDAKVRPDATMGYAACEAARDDEAREGNVGAGMGCSVGKMLGMGSAMKGGLGTAIREAGGLLVGAIVAVNAAGDVVDPFYRRDHRRHPQEAGKWVCRQQPVDPGYGGPYGALLHWQHGDWRDCHKCQTDESRREQGGANGPRWIGARHSAGAHHDGRGYGFHHGHRRQKSVDYPGGCAGRPRPWRKRFVRGVRAAEGVAGLPAARDISL